MQHDFDCIFRGPWRTRCLSMRNEGILFGGIWLLRKEFGISGARSGVVFRRTMRSIDCGFEGS